MTIFGTEYVVIPSRLHDGTLNFEPMNGSACYCRCFLADLSSTLPPLRQHGQDLKMIFHHQLGKNDEDGHYLIYRNF